jgi:hypothetical protein
MDMRNTFHSRSTYRLMRLDYLVLLGILSAVVLAHAGQVHWWRFVVAFSWIDLISTVPAYYIYYGRRNGRHRSIPLVWYRLYNFAHSLTTNAIIVGVWYALTGSVEWAMLAAPIHIFGDRALFGNVFKPDGLSFEPVYHPAFERFLEEYEQAGRW